MKSKQLYIRRIERIEGALRAIEVSLGQRDTTTQTIKQRLDVVNGEIKVPNDYAFYHIRKLTMGATIASMIAYVSAQFIDVQIFHFLKEKTKGKKLWLRNNVSTIFSQLIDSIAVILITHYLVSMTTKVKLIDFFHHRTFNLFVF